jgi:hypothetical protein
MPLVPDEPDDVEAIRAAGHAFVPRYDVDKHSLSISKGFRPLVFECSVGATVEIAVLGEMVEPLSRAVESNGDVMAAIIVKKAIWLAGIPLVSP